MFNTYYFFWVFSKAEVSRLRRVEDYEFGLAPGVEITKIAQVKRLEFDYVILVQAAAGRFQDTPAARRLLHVGATRAVHPLWLTTVGDPSPVVRDALRRRAGADV